MYADATKVKNNFGAYLEKSQMEEIRIRKNGTVVAVLRGVGQEKRSIIDGLTGVIPANVDEDTMRSMRRARK